MATATTPQRTTQFVGSRTDNYFFSGMALLLLVTVFVGFARTYFLAGVFCAPLPACWSTSTEPCSLAGFFC